MFRALLSFITHRVLWQFIGITLVNYVIWVIGPLVAVGERFPLRAEWSRQGVIGLLILLWVGMSLIPCLVRYWLMRSTLPVVETAEPSPLKASVRRFDDVMLQLKKARIQYHNLSRWAFFTGRDFRQTPCFLLIGAPGSGKTSLLRKGHLRAQYASYATADEASVTETSDLEWLYTQDHVITDIPGRYFASLDNNSTAANEWTNTLHLLKKNRARLPVKGVIISVSVKDMLSHTSHTRVQYARALQARLLELQEVVGPSLPLYLIVTKTDVLEGFLAYFNSLTQTQREQVWGISIPTPQGPLSHREAIVALEQQWDRLQERLLAALPDTLHSAQDTYVRGKSVVFLQAFADLRQRLTPFLTEVFHSNYLGNPLLLEGIYFTGITSPEHALEQTAPPAGSHVDWEKECEPEHPAHSFHPFFVQGAFDALFLHSTQRAINKDTRCFSFKRLRKVAHYLILFTVLISLGTVWDLSYLHNREYLHRVQEKLPDLTGLTEQPLSVQEGDIFSLLPLLNSLKELPESPAFSLTQPPLLYRLGLYRGKEVQEAAESVYQKALKERLWPQVAQLITHTLHDDERSDTDFSYEALKAYQMLYQPTHYDGAFLHAWVMLNLQHHLPKNTTQAQVEQISKHLRQLLGSSPLASQYVKDPRLAEQATQRLLRTPLSQRAYERLTRILLNRAAVHSVSVIDLAGPQTELIFVRKSHHPLTEGVPGLFTAAGYRDVFRPEMASVIDTLYQEQTWVLGQAPSENKEGLSKTVLSLYMQDFILNWESLLGDIQLAHTESVEQRTGSARVLSGPLSPLRNLLVNVRKNVLLESEINAQTGKKIQGVTNELPSRARSTLEALFTQTPDKSDHEVPLQPEQMLSDHFSTLDELGKAQGDASATIPFDTVIKQLDELYHYLTAVQDAANSGMALPSSDIIPRLQAESYRLPSPFGRLVLSLVFGASRDIRTNEIDVTKKKIDVGVGSFCRQVIQGNYPLTPHARREITPEDFSRMFAPVTGLVETSLKANLEGQIDTTKGDWQFTSSIEGKPSTEGSNILHSFQQAQRIKEAFFTTGTTTPSFKVTLTPVSMDSNILSMTWDIDGQIITYSHGPQIPQVVEWPGKGATNQVYLQLSLRDGSTVSLQTTGAWALNRMIDMAKQTQEEDTTSALISFDISGHHIAFEMVPHSFHNPFPVPAFSCPSAERK